MKIIFRITSALLARVRADLSRSHPFAAERVGYIACKMGSLDTKGILILASDYLAVGDDNYLEDPYSGATIGSNAIRLAMTKSYRERFSMFHVHPHPHSGIPWFSRTDVYENQKMVPDFFKVQPHLPHGSLVLSDDVMAGLCWLPQTRKPVRISDFVIVGTTMRIDRGHAGGRCV